MPRGLNKALVYRKLRPGAPCTMDSSILNARRRLTQHATNITQLAGLTSQPSRGGGVKKIVGGQKRSEGETRIRVEGGVLVGANPHKSCNRFLDNYKAEFGLKQHLTCGAKLACAHFHFSSP